MQFIIKYLEQTYNVADTTTSIQLKTLLKLPKSSFLRLNGKVFLDGDIKSTLENNEYAINLTVETVEDNGEIDFLKIIISESNKQEEINYSKCLTASNNYSILTYNDEQIEFGIPIFGILLFEYPLVCFISTNLVFYNLKEKKALYTLKIQITDFQDVSNKNITLLENLATLKTEQIKRDFFITKNFKKFFIIKNNDSISLLELKSKNNLFHLNLKTFKPEEIGLRDDVLEFNFINNSFILVYDFYVSVFKENKTFLIKNFAIKNVKRTEKGFIISTDKKVYFLNFEGENLNKTDLSNDRLIKFRDVKESKGNLILLVENSLFLITKNEEVKMLKEETERISYFDFLNETIVYSIGTVLHFKQLL